MLKKVEYTGKRKPIKKSGYQFVIINPVRGNIYDANGLELTSTDFMYKMIYKKNSKVGDVLYDKNSCLEYKNSSTAVCKVSVDYIYNNLELLRLFETNVYPVFKRRRDFVDHDLDFLGTTSFADGKEKNMIIRNTIKKLSRRIDNRKHVKRIIRMLKSTDILVGNFGLELYYDLIMRGNIGIVKKVDNDNVVIQDIRVGNNIYMTLDMELNKIIKNELRQFCKKLKTNCSAIGINAENGDILFFSEVKKDNLEKPTKQFYFSNIYQGLFPPGSILKPFVSLEFLEKNVISKDTKTYCGGRIKLYNRIFNCGTLSGHGNVDVTFAIEHSCNVFFYSNIQKLTAQGLQDFIDRFKLNRRVHIDLPNEFLPKVNVPINPLNKTLFAIGQIDVYVSLLKLVQLYSLFHNKNFMPVPHIVRTKNSMFKVNNGSRRIDKIYVKVKPKNIQIVKQGLYDVVHGKRGTAHNLGLEKYEIYGKTGTVQVGSNLKPHSLFCGVWEGRVPVSLCVIMENSGSGREYAAKFTYNLIEILEKFLK